MTDEEKTLWSHIWRVPVEGTHFRKQAPLGIYVPDFISHRLKLIIEVDGPIHDHNDQRKHDEQRTQWFESQGYRVIRFTNQQVKTEMNAVLDMINAAIADRVGEAQSPLVTPPRR